VAFSAAASDGKVVLWVRPTDKLEAHAMAGTDDVIFPFWSPDSKSLGFFADGKLKTIDLNGGSPQSICDAPQGRGGSWGPNGVVLMTADTQAPIVRVNINGGAPIAVTKLESHPAHLPSLALLSS
jgi:hypothetical protein